MMKNVRLFLLLNLINRRVSGTPIVEGDNKPGMMFDLPYPLGSEYWIPPHCKVDSSISISTSLAHQKKNFKDKRPRRPRGWEKNTLELGEEILDEIIKRLSQGKVQEFCPYLTRQCCLELKLYDKHSELVNITGILKENKISNCSDVPSLPENSLGSCAFVAPGSSLLRIPQGKFIDEHDTIVRLGHEPLQVWKKYTGSKTTAVIGKKNWEKRAKAKRSLEKRQNRAAKEYTGIKYKFGHDSSLRKYEKKGTGILHILDFGATKVLPQQHKLSNGMEYLSGNILNLHQSLYRAMTVPARGRIRRQRSTGYEEILKLLFSGLCSRIDVFGLTANCGGYYHDREHVMSVHHSCELESWSLHYIMRSLRGKHEFCVWI